jgi:hypothetical protein
MVEVVFVVVVVMVVAVLVVVFMLVIFDFLSCNGNFITTYIIKRPEYNLIIITIIYLPYSSRSSYRESRSRLSLGSTC